MLLLDEKLEGSTKTLFLESLFTYEDGLKMEIVGTSRVFRGKMDNKPTIFVDVKILSPMSNCKVRVLDDNGNPIRNSNNSYKTTEVDAQDFIIGIDFKLTPMDKNEVSFNSNTVYKITPKTNIFSILNYSLKEKGLIGQDNKRGFGLTEEEIKEALIGVTFVGKSERVTDTDYKPYFRLIVGGNLNEH